MALKKTLWRAADDDFVRQGTAFAERRQDAEVYLDNPGFGGSSVWRARVVLTEPASVMDFRGMSTAEAAAGLGLADPGAIGIDEWLPRSQRALDALEQAGVHWALVDESFPEGTTTWIWISGDEPELESVE